MGSALQSARRRARSSPVLQAAALTRRIDCKGGVTAGLFRPLGSSGQSGGLGGIGGGKPGSDSLPHPPLLLRQGRKSLPAGRRRGLGGRRRWVPYRGAAIGLLHSGRFQGGRFQGGRFQGGGRLEKSGSCAASVLPGRGRPAAGGAGALQGAAGIVRGQGQSGGLGAGSGGGRLPRCLSRCLSGDIPAVEYSACRGAATKAGRPWRRRPVRPDENRFYRRWRSPNRAVMSRDAVKLGTP